MALLATLRMCCTDPGDEVKPLTTIGYGIDEVLINIVV